MTIRHVVTITAITLLLAPHSQAANPTEGLLRSRRSATPENRTVLRTTSRLVLVPVSVRNALDAPVRGLPKQAFRIFVDGVEQEVRTFSEEEGPVSAGIVFDASKSMQDRLQRSREAVTRLFDRRLPGDEYLAVAFNNAPKLVCGLTSDSELVRGTLSRIGAQGWTSLYDGIYMSAGLMRKATNGRRVLLILSDGEDNYSRYTSSEVRRYLREAGVTIFAIALSGNGLVGLRNRTLRLLAEETGGWLTPIDTLDDLDKAVSAISVAARSYYVLGIAPPELGNDGKYRRVRVTVGSPAATLRVTARSGFYATD